jgi:hypothetical protein
MKLPVVLPLILISPISEIVPAAENSVAHPHALLSTLMTMSISMHEDLAARAVEIMQRTRKVTKTVVVHVFSNEKTIKTGRRPH